MTSRPPTSLPFAILLTLSVASFASAQSFTENHPGLWVEWLARTDSTIGATALADADQDGDPDLFLVDGSSLELWRNDGRGEFTADLDAVSPLPLLDLIALDFDGDARADLAATVAGGGIAFFKNMGGGVFAAPVVTASGTTYARLAEIDVNGDGNRDLVATLARPARGIDLFMWNGASFAITTRLLSDFEVASVTPADLNVDGRMDLIAGTWWFGESVQLQVLLNGGSGLEVGAVVPSGTVAERVLAFDFDGDADLDVLYRGGEYYQPRLIQGDGTGHNWEPREITTDLGSYGQSFASADFDHDGDAELCVAWRSGNQGAVFGLFDPRSDPELSSPRLMSYTHVSYGVNVIGPDQIIVDDVNRDGWPDVLLISNSGPAYAYDRSSKGMVGVVPNRGGIPGAMHLAALDAIAWSIAAVRFGPTQPSLIVVGGPDGLFLTSMRGDGTLEPSRRIGDGVSARAADLNGDGRDELIVRLASGQTQIRPTSQAGVEAVTAEFEGKVVDYGTIDPDPWTDLIVERADGRLEILWGDRHARFKRVTPTGLATPTDYGYGTIRFILADTDGDDRKELVECIIRRRVGSASEPPLDTVVVQRLLANGRMDRVRTSVLPPSLISDQRVRMIRAGNLDGIPGDEIVLLASSGGSNNSRLLVLRLKGNSEYEIAGDWPAGGEGPDGLTLADLDGDGDLDVACTGNYEGQSGVVNVRWNDGRGSLLGGWARRIANLSAWNVVAGDLNGDGVADLVTLAGYSGFPPTLAILFGRRDDLFALVTQVEFSQAPPSETANGITILGIGPNPARESFAIRWRARPGSPVSIELHDVAGRRLRNVDVAVANASESESRFESLHDLPAGLYWVRLRQGKQTVTKRVALIR